MLNFKKTLWIKFALTIGYLLWSLPGTLSNGRPCWCHGESNAEDQIYQIVGVSANGTFVLQNLDRFASILQSPAVGNRTVAVVGIVGRYRSGKSTLLNIIHRYLMCLPKNATNQTMTMDSWLYERPDFPACKKVFGTASAAKGLTKGIWITHEPILLPDDKGQETAVFLIDTQGMMDNVNSQAAESPLFYLTNLLSSTMIVNTMGVLERSFTDLVGSLTLQITNAVAKENVDEGKVLQQLVFLVRDWELEQQELEEDGLELEELRPDYGWASGKSYFEGYFATNRQESAVIGKELEVAYENVSCFLMPRIAENPKGLKIIPSRLKPDFGPQCESFLHDLFTASHLTPKRIFGKTVNGPEFVQHVQLFANMFGNGTLQSVGDVYSLQLDLLANEKISRISAAYRKDMVEFLADLEEISDTDLFNIHRYHHARGLTALHNDSMLQRKSEILDKGVAVFDNSTQASYAEFARQQEEKRAALQERLLMVGRFTVQLAKEKYRTRMDKDIANNFYNMSELMQRHGKWKTAVQEEFLYNNTDITRKTTVYNKTLILFEAETNLMLDQYVHKVVQDDRDLRSAVTEAVAKYRGFMNQSLPDFPLLENFLQEKSRSAIQHVRIGFLQTGVVKSKSAAAGQELQTMLTAHLQSEAHKYIRANRNEKARRTTIARAAINLAKQRYRVLMDEDVAKNFYTVAELEERHNHWKDILRDTYIDGNTEISSKRNIYNATVALYESEIAMLKSQYASNTEQEQRDLNTAVTSAKNEYMEIMDRSLSEYPLPKRVLQTKSSQAFLSVRPKLTQSRILRSKPDTIPYQEQLIEDIERNSSRKYYDDNNQQIETMRDGIPSLTDILSRLGTALLSKWLPSAGDAVSLATGNPWFIAVQAAITAIPKIARLVVLLTDEQHDARFQRMIQEFKVVNDRLSVLEAKIVQYNTIQPIKNEYRRHLETISNIKSKVNAMLQNNNNATKDEFLRICELQDPSNILNWMKERATGHYGSILGYFLSDIIEGVEYNRTAYGFWMESIMALNTQAILYRLMYMQISGKFDNATMTSQTTHMELQAQIISDALTTKDTQLRSEYSTNQLEKDIRSQLVSYHNRGLDSKAASSKLMTFLAAKYNWVNWMVALYNDDCGDHMSRYSMTELQYPSMDGMQSGMIVLKPVAKWNAVVAWKSDNAIQATRNPEREIAQVKRRVSDFTSHSHYNHAQTPSGTWVRGIRKAGVFWNSELKDYVNSARLQWNAVVIVKNECNLELRPSETSDSRFFVKFFDGYSCEFKNKPFLCGTLLRWGEAHIIVFPAGSR